MANETRKYRMIKRAGTQVQTRERIVASTAQLHATIGPAKTTMSAVADHAGVPRSTVYRHFEDEAALVVACATHWQMANQPPPLEPWAAIEDPDQRLTRALREIYAYYRSAGTMMENVLRDEAAVPVLSEVLGRFRGYLAAAHEILMSDRPSRGSAHRKTRAAIGHALAYTTWQSLARHNQLTDTEAADLMAKLAAAVDIANTGIRTRSEKQAGR
jgi:AcrR family transcriptional regulator